MTNTQANPYITVNVVENDIERLELLKLTNNVDDIDSPDWMTQENMCTIWHCNEEFYGKFYEDILYLDLFDMNDRQHLTELTKLITEYGHYFIWYALKMYGTLEYLTSLLDNGMYIGLFNTIFDYIAYAMDFDSVDDIGTDDHNATEFQLEQVYHVTLVDIPELNKVAVFSA